MGFDRKFAVRFSFLLSIPAVLGANILTLKDAIQENSIIVSDIPVYPVSYTHLFPRVPLRYALPRRSWELAPAPVNRQASGSEKRSTSMR